MITDGEREKIREKIIDHLLPNATALHRFRYIYGGQDEILWYGINSQSDAQHISQKVDTRSEIQHPRGQCLPFSTKP
jgi:hypothetical protein